MSNPAEVGDETLDSVKNPGETFSEKHQIQKTKKAEIQQVPMMMTSTYDQYLRLI